MSGVEGEYKKDLNNVSFFNIKNELDKFIEYSKQDSIALLEALLTARNISLRDYNVDIT